MKPARPTDAPGQRPGVGALALFRTLFEHGLEAALLTLPGGAVLAVNRRACAVFGGSEQALCQRSGEAGPGRSAKGDAPQVHSFLADHDDPRLQAFLKQRAENGHARAELRLRRLDGETFDAEVCQVPFPDEGGAQTSLLTVRDISALRRAERLAQESEQRLGFALDAAEIGDWDMDLRSNVARRSLRHDRCFGYTEAVAEWGYDTFLSHVHADDRERVDACYRAAMAGQGEYDVEFRVHWPDGSQHWLWSRGRFYFDDDGKPYRVAGIQVDITDRHSTLEALRRSEERMQLVLRGANDAPWDLDLVTQEAYYSPRWLQMLGYDELPAGDDAEFWTRLWHPDDAQRVRDTYEAALRGSADTYEMEFRMRHRDGHYVAVQSRGFVLRDADGRALRVSGVNADVSERHRLREAQRLQAAAEAANAAKSEFLSHMSHELRTPLNAIIGFSHLLTLGDGSESQRTQARFIERAGHDLLNMVEEMLDLGRIEAGRLDLHPAPTDIAALLEECRAMVAGDAAARDIALQVHHDAAVPVALVDRTRLRQVLLNLLGNAIKYSPAGARVTLDGRPLDGGGIEFAVADDGPGLSQAQHSQLFQPFNRLGREAGSVPGTGIGLVICKRLVDAMGGSIAVRSASGAGSTFIVRLPASTAA